MGRVQKLFLYDEGEPTMADLLRLSPEQVMALSAHVDRYGFTGTPEQLLALAERLGISYEKTADIIQYSSYLQSERARLNLDANGFLEEFDIYLERHKNDPEAGTREKLKTLYEPLRKLFSDRPQVALREKVSSVTAGVVPEGIDFRSICDLRPIFNEERDKILDYVPVALIRIMLRAETNQDTAVSFQIDESGIEKMVKFFERLRKKMEMLKEVRANLIGVNK